MIGEFDPIAYVRHIRTHPENYIRMEALIKQMTATAPLRAARNLAELKHRFTEATRSAKGDNDLIEYLMEVKDKRKTELEDACPIS